MPVHSKSATMRFCINPEDQSEEDRQRPIQAGPREAFFQPIEKPTGTRKTFHLVNAPDETTTVSVFVDGEQVVFKAKVTKEGGLQLKLDEAPDKDAIIQVRVVQ